MLVPSFITDEEKYVISHAQKVNNNCIWNKVDIAPNITSLREKEALSPG